MDTTIPSPRDLRFGYPPLPNWVIDFRPTQWEAAQEVVSLFDQGYQVVLTEAPTGSGKSLVGELVRRIMGLRAIYLCSTKQLQEQLRDSFPYAALLWGRSNYETRNYPDQFPFINASFCDKSEEHQCDLCDPSQEMGCTFCCPDISGCPYEMAKHEALASSFSVMNYRYWLTEANYVGKFGAWTSKKTGQVVRKPLIVGDECDVIEDELMGFVELAISPRRRRQFDIAIPARKTVETAWIQWANETELHLRSVLNRLPRNPTDPDKIRDRQWVLNTYQQVGSLVPALEKGGWVYDEGSGEWIRFLPVKVDHQANRHLWRHADRWLLMSATICAPEVMAADLGLEDGTWTSFSLPSSFDPKRRPIYVVPRASMKAKTKDTEWPKMIAAIDELLDSYPNERALVPTVSYELTRFLMTGLAERHQHRLITYATAAQRMESLKRYRAQPGAVLLAPSMDRGVDLAGEDCRLVIIAKIPWPNRGDRQVKARQGTVGGRDWYTVRTIRRLVQSTGRGVRHAEDWADCFILDADFTGLYAKYSRWFPKWWREAIDWTRGGRNALQTPGRARQEATRQTARIAVGED